MTSHLWTRSLLALVVGAAGSWQAARADEFHCRNGGQERRIELSGADAAQGRACEVRYWQDATVPDSGRVLWYAQQDAEFCAAKTRDLVARLEAGGWTCAAGEQPSAPGPADPQEAALPRSDAPAPIVPDPGARVPAAPAPAASEPAAPAPEASSERATAAPAAPSPADPAPMESAAPEQLVGPLSTHPAAELLDQVVQETLRSVEQLYGGEFQAERTTFGDLDGDGEDDAAVLITYEAARDDYVQYLVAYLFNGETFQSVATRNVGGRFLDAVRADLEGDRGSPDPGRARGVGRGCRVLRDAPDRVRVGGRPTDRGGRSGRTGCREDQPDRAVVLRLTVGLRARAVRRPPSEPTAAAGQRD